jgi:hypothetical protein
VSPAADEGGQGTGTRARTEDAYSREGWPPAIAYALGGAAVVASGLTIWSGLDTLHFHDDVYAGATTNANFDVGLEKQLRTNILLGATVLLGGLTALAIYFTDFHRPLFGKRSDRNFAALQ